MIKLMRKLFLSCIVVIYTAASAGIVSAEEEIPETEAPVSEETAEEEVPADTAEEEAPAGEVTEEVLSEEQEVIPEEVPVQEGQEPVIEEQPVPEDTEALPEAEPVTEEVLEEEVQEAAEVITEEVTEEAETAEALPLNVTLHAGKGTFSDGSASLVKQVEKNTALSGVQEPVKTSAKFYAWYTDPSFEEQYRITDLSAYIIRADTDLYARYTDYHTVTFHANSHGTLSIGGSAYAAKKKVKVNVKTRISARPDLKAEEGYIFDGWFTNAKCTPEYAVDLDTYLPRGDVTLYAKWVHPLEITFNLNGGKIGTKKKLVRTVLSTHAVGEVEEPVKDGAKFAGWYLDPELTKKVPYVFGYYPEKDTDFYAKWDDRIKVQFILNGGRLQDGSESYTVTAASGKELRDAVDEPVRNGYIFSGWYYDESLKKRIDDIYHFTAYSDSLVFAKYVRAYTVTFKPGNGYFLEDGEKVTAYKAYCAPNKTLYECAQRVYDAHGMYDESRVNIPEAIPKKSTQVFEGWYSDKELTKKADLKKATFGANTVLYAKYTDKPASVKKYTLTVDPLSGNIDRSAASVIRAEKGTMLKDLDIRVNPPKGKILLGFTTVKNDRGTLLEDTYKLNKNMTVYALYGPECLITLYAQSGFEHDGSAYEGIIRLTNRIMILRTELKQPVTLTGEMLTNKAGMVFAGWYSDRECTKLVAKQLHGYTPQRDMTLYAKWMKALKPGWQKNKKGWWYRRSDGSWPADGFAVINKKTYYFDEKGYMVTGWKKINGSWYYFRSGGEMARNWVKVKEKWYYMDDAGEMITGWKQIDCRWYYLGRSGAMYTGWHKFTNNKWRYFDETGVMVTGKYKIKNKVYTFNSRGVWIRDA
ncbi:MAG: InlB B-repeat-containing protein [Solobacterium sp.]|nr:InlB B-repeat-containing protein [Solobacterium sp.]